MYLLTNERTLQYSDVGLKWKLKTTRISQNLPEQEKAAPRCCYYGSFQENRQHLTGISEHPWGVTCRFYGIRTSTGGNYPHFKVSPFLALVIICLTGFRLGLGKISQGAQKLLRNDMSSCTLILQVIHRNKPLWQMVNALSFYLFFFFFFLRIQEQCVNAALPYFPSVSVLEVGSHWNARGKASYNSGYCTTSPLTLINWLLGAKLLIPARGHFLLEVFPLSQVLSWYKSGKSV